MQPDPFHHYLVAISRHPLLSPAQEVELAHAVQAMIRLEAARSTETPQPLSVAETRILQRGQQAKQQVIEANLRLVVKVAKRYQHKGLSMDDLIQEGAIGLNRAVEKFDPTRGYKFSTYAYWWIKQAMTRGLSDKSRTIRLPVHIVEKLNRIKKAERLLSQELGRKPTRIEVAARLKLRPDQVQQTYDHARGTVSLNDLVGEDTELGEFMQSEDGVSPQAAVEQSEMQRLIHTMLSSLSPVQQQVLIARHGIGESAPQTLAQIGEQLNLSRERVRQIERAALARLRGAWGGKTRSLIG